jgi:Ala-tRNA(Pro) deacylase
MGTIKVFLKYLWDNGVKFTVQGLLPAIDDRSPAADAGIPPPVFVNTTFIMAGRQFWMVVLPAGKRPDTQALQQALKVKEVRLAKEEDLAHLFPDCDIDSVPPFGNLYGFPIIVDSPLARHENIAFNAGTREESITMKFTDYKRLTRPLIAECGEPSGRADREHLTGDDPLVSAQFYCRNCHRVFWRRLPGKSCDTSWTPECKICSSKEIEQVFPRQEASQSQDA